MKFFSDIAIRYAYQNKYQFFQDLEQPFSGLGNILWAIPYTVMGFFQLFTGSFKPFAVGLFTLGLGLFQVASTPFTWTLQPLLKGLATWIARKEISAEIVTARRKFADFATKNVACFQEGTYFLVSMTMSNWKEDTLVLYPGAGSKFRDGATIPDQFRDPFDPQKIHPDLDIRIRIKAHRVFHEQILGHRISLAQTLMANESVIFFESRGGGAILKEGQLIPQYKSGVLNGKWSLGRRLAYGDLLEQDRPRFDAALRLVTKPSSNPQDNAFQNGPPSGATLSRSFLNPQISDHAKKNTDPGTATDWRETTNNSSNIRFPMWSATVGHSTRNDSREELVEHREELSDPENNVINF